MGWPACCFLLYSIGIRGKIGCSKIIPIDSEVSTCQKQTGRSCRPCSSGGMRSTTPRWNSRPMASISASSATGIGAERSQPRLQRLKEYRIYFILPRGTFNKLNKLVSHSSKVLLSAEALFMLRNELNYAKMKIVIKMRHFCLRNSIKMYKTLVTRKIL